MLEVRPFARHDRDGLTSLVNRHIAAVLPGGAVPVAALLSQLEHDAQEPIVDPWVIDRRAIVGIANHRVVAAAYLKRYASDDRPSDSYRDAGEIHWLVFDPQAGNAGRQVLEAAMTQLRDWRSRAWYADGTLPCLGVYGVPDAWPHVQRLLAEAGFDDCDGQIEVLFSGDLAQAAPPGTPPKADLQLRRCVGTGGTAFEAYRAGTIVGAFEVEADYGVTNSLLAGWADVANHWVAAEHRGDGIGTWLFRHGCAWLRTAGKQRLLAYAIERPSRHAAGEEPPSIERTRRYLKRQGLGPLTRTRRGWSRPPD